MIDGCVSGCLIKSAPPGPVHKRGQPEDQHRAQPTFSAQCGRAPSVLRSHSVALKATAKKKEKFEMSPILRTRSRLERRSSSVRRRCVKLRALCRRRRASYRLSTPTMKLFLSTSLEQWAVEPMQFNLPIFLGMNLEPSARCCLRSHPAGIKQFIWSPQVFKTHSLLGVFFPCSVTTTHWGQCALNALLRTANWRGRGGGGV